MRRTVTLDSDVEALIRKLMERRGLSFEEAVNDSLRAALLPASSGVEYSFPTYDLGHPAPSMERARQVADHLEDDAIARKLIAGR